mgnify:CR=1 FL=1
MQQLSFEINGVATPMDVLLTLIAKHKLNIYDIAISQLLKLSGTGFRACRSIP